MRVTVCQFGDDERLIADEWEAISDHARATQSDLLVLPEMPFHPWMFTSPVPDPVMWESAVAAHDYWGRRLAEAGTVVLGSRPITTDGIRRNEAFAWSPDGGYRPVHHKRYLPDEAGFWEASWYEPGDGTFDVCVVAGMTVGFLVCSEVWFPEHAREYGRAGAQIVAAPRATDAASPTTWLAAARTVAVISGAFCVSSNRAGRSQGIDWAGAAWVIDPDGEVLALTSHDDPIVTVDIDLQAADEATGTYPRYLR